MTRTLSSLLVLLTVTSLGQVSWAQAPQSEDAEVHPAPVRPCLEARCNLPVLSKRELKRLMVSPEDLRRKAVIKLVAGGVLLGLGTLLGAGAVAMGVMSARTDHGPDGYTNVGYLFTALLALPAAGLSAGGAALLVGGIRARARADELERRQAAAPGRRVTVGWSCTF